MIDFEEEKELDIPVLLLIQSVDCKESIHKLEMRIE